jgi:hypothetical protein
MDTAPDPPRGHQADPDRNRLDALIGPFYNTDGVAALLGGLPRTAVAARREAGELLGVKTSDGVWIYPVFQFAVHPALRQAIKALADSPRWSAALWFVTENPELDEKTPVEWAQQEGDVEALVRSAKATNHDFR